MYLLPTNWPTAFHESTPPSNNKNRPIMLIVSLSKLNHIKFSPNKGMTINSMSSMNYVKAFDYGLLNCKLLPLSPYCLQSH